MLYVIDSVTRQWVEHARKAGQTPGPAASDGTFAAGVNHVTELLPSIMTDIINTAPEDQKVRFLDDTRRITGLVEDVHFGCIPYHCVSRLQEICLFTCIRDGCRLTYALAN